MGGTANWHEIDPIFGIITLGFVAIVLGEVAVLAVQRWRGRVTPDYTGWDPRFVLADRRYWLVFDLVLGVGWAAVALTFIHYAFQLGASPPAVSRFGSITISPVVALLLGQAHRWGLNWLLWATALRLERLISRRWSQPRFTPWPAGQSMLAMYLAVAAIAIVAMS